MEPLSTLSLFCNILDLCNHTIKVSRECKEIYRSATGRRTQDEDLLKYLAALQQIQNNLGALSSKLNGDNLKKSLVELLNDMEAKVAAVKAILDDIRPKRPITCFASAISVTKAALRQGRLNRAVEKLKECQNAIHFAIAQSTRVQIGEIFTQADQLHKGQRNIQSRLSSLDTRLRDLGQDLSEVPDIILKAKGISDDVRTELCALAMLRRLGKTNERFCIVPAAESHTLHWILRDNDANGSAAHIVQQASDDEERYTDVEWGT